MSAHSAFYRQTKRTPPTHTHHLFPTANSSPSSFHRQVPTAKYPPRALQVPHIEYMPEWEPARPFDANTPKSFG